MTSNTLQFSSVAIGFDHNAVAYKAALMAHLVQLGVAADKIVDVGTFTSERCDACDFAKSAVQHVLAAKEPVEAKARTAAILICGTGQTMGIMANRYKGIRAVVASDAFGIKSGRDHIDANVLCLGAMIVSVEQMKELVSVFVTTPANMTDPRYKARQVKLDE